MERKTRDCRVVGLFVAFALWTIAVSFVDLQAIGPNGSTVGFATLNGFVHGVTGVHRSLYTITDWLGLVPIFLAMGFGVLGLIQWITRKHLLKVDADILVLGGFYLVVLLLYILFETVVINYRPVLIEGVLEASYPSSTTMLVLCVMPTAALQFRARIHNRAVKRCVVWLIVSFTMFMVVARLVSGVHWFSDIVGGVLLSAGLVTLYHKITTEMSKIRYFLLT